MPLPCADFATVKPACFRALSLLRPGVRVLRPAVHYDARSARKVQMVAWADCRATGGFRCLDDGQLQWPPAGALRRRRPAGPDQPRKTVFGFCGFAGAGLTLTGAAHSLACLRTGPLA
eukprot:COSAG02_NODE_4629_length_5148_cov_4.810061_1_plen_118_part_00